MTIRQRIVVDTNVLVSRLLLPAPVPSQAVPKAIDTGQILVSEASLEELADVLSRRRFDAYVSIEDRQEFLRLLGRVDEMVPVMCRYIRAAIAAERRSLQGIRTKKKYAKLRKTLDGCRSLFHTKRAMRRFAPN